MNLGRAVRVVRVTAVLIRVIIFVRLQAHAMIDWSGSLRVCRPMHAIIVHMRRVHLVVNTLYRFLDPEVIRSVVQVVNIHVRLRFSHVFVVLRV
ncbi:hypothetical protein BJY01DRAFT_219431, partial [Aspergillus pseudoustus]